MEKELIEIVKVEYIGDFKLRIFFNDGIEREISFKTFLKSAKNPMTAQFFDEDKFKNYRLEYGDIIWGDYELCFPIYDLYSGVI